MVTNNQNEQQPSLESLDIDVESVARDEASSQAEVIDRPAPQFVEVRKKTGFKTKIKALLKSKKFWIVTILCLLASLLAAWFIQPSRLWMVNIIGQRTSLHVAITVPAEGKQPAAKLKSATVLVSDKQYQTNQDGQVEISDQPYGVAEVVARKNGYEEATIRRMLDFDPFFHAFGGKEADEDARNIQLSVRSVGLPLIFKVVDWLSGLPIAGGEYQLDDLTVKADEEGVVAFKAPPSENNKATIRSSHGGLYIDKTFELSFNDAEIPTITFVPAGKHYFTSRRDGALSVYRSNLDGSDVQLIIPGTGQETAYTPFVVSPDGKYGLLASTRDGAKDQQNNLLQRLYLVDLDKKQLKKIDEAHYFAFADWTGSRLVYQKQQTANVNDSNKTVSLRAVDVTTSVIQDIAEAADFGRVTVAFNQVAYAHIIQTDADTNAYTTSFKRFDMQNSTNKDLGDDITNTIVQPNYDTVVFQLRANQRWQEYNFNTGQLKDTSQPTAAATQVVLGSPSPDDKKRILVDRIDGQFTIIIKTTADGAQKQLYGTGGLGGPIRWIQNEVLVFRVSNEQETADYAISAKGGEPKKIADVTAVVDSQHPQDVNNYSFY
jgi:hypothetical protein